MWRPSVSPSALPGFCGDRLQRLHVQRLFRHHLFKPPVFVFQLAQFLPIIDFEPGKFRPPLIAGHSIVDLYQAIDQGAAARRLVMGRKTIHEDHKCKWIIERER